MSRRRINNSKRRQRERRIEALYRLRKQHGYTVFDLNQQHPINIRLIEYLERLKQEQECDIATLEQRIGA